VELRDDVKLLIDVALSYLKKRVEKDKIKHEKKVEQDEEMEDDNWTDDEAMKIFLSIVKVLQINFPLYKVHKLYAGVSRNEYCR
jgi:hypothetical protein